MIESIIGKVFTRLTVIEKVGKNKAGTKTLYRCRCKCGKYVTVDHNAITRGNTRSCGCLREETRAQHGLKLRQRNFRNNIIANKIQEDVYWENILDRCELEGEERKLANMVRNNLYMAAEEMTKANYVERPERKSFYRRNLARMIAKCLLDDFMWKDILDGCQLTREERWPVEVVRFTITNIADDLTMQEFNTREIL